MNDTHLDCDVVVVGAGLSGLVNAHLLCEAGLNTLVLEAAGRIGGRIHSLRVSSSGDYIADLGATWVWPTYQPIITKWLDRLDIRTFCQFEAGNAVFELDKETSVRHHPAPKQHGIRRIHGGPQELINTLSRSLPKDTIRTGHKVTTVAINQGTVEVSTASPSVTTIRAKRIVVAVPMRIASHTITWPPCLEKNILHHMSETPTWMATQAKAVMLYDEPFWRDRELSGRIASQIGPLVEVHDHSMPDGGQASLFGFIGLPHGELRLSRESLQDQINQQLVKCLGEQAQNITEIHIEDWATNSLICTDLDLATSPSHPEIVSDLLRTPHCGDRIYFSVAETALQSPGLIEGAFAASELSIKNLIASL